LSRAGPSPDCLPASQAVHGPTTLGEDRGRTRGETDTHVEDYVS
jgi:hypothetical protein